MKTLMVVVCMMVACDASVPSARNPRGYKPCSSDMSCDEGEYCGFIGVDQGAVCRPDNNIYPQVPRR